MSDKVILKGFPNQVSEHIELPSIAELMLYPNFFDNYYEDAMKYGTEFQKYVLNKVPLSGKKKYVSVLWQVRFLTPNVRSCTHIGDNITPIREWHIDCEEESKHEYTKETDVVHLMLNKTTSPTEFLEHEVVVDASPETPYREFITHFQNDYDRLNVMPKAVEPNRIVTFTNHLHRATPSKEPEFKFMLRVVETDRERAPKKYNPVTDYCQPVDIFDPDKGTYVPNLVRERGRVTIHLPSITSDMLWNERKLKS